MKTLSNQSPMPFTEYFSLSIRFAHQHYGTLLVFSLLQGLYYFGLSVANHFAPDNRQFSVLLMAAWLLWIPLIGSSLYRFEDLICKENTTAFKALSETFARLLSLLGCLLGVILVPAIILGLGLGGYLTLAHYGQDKLVPVLIAVILVSLVASFTSRLPVLTLTMIIENTSDLALEQYQNLTKGQWFKTLLRSTLIWVLLLGIFCLPLVLPPNAINPIIGPYLPWITSSLLIILVSPYLWSFIVIDLHNLCAIAQKKRADQPKKPLIKEVSPEKAAKENTDWF